MLTTIISVFIANVMFFAVWILVAGFTRVKAIDALEYEEESPKFETCGDPDCECSLKDCD